MVKATGRGQTYNDGEKERQQLLVPKTCKAVTKNMFELIHFDLAWYDETAAIDYKTT